MDTYTTITDKLAHQIDMFIACLHWSHIGHSYYSADLGDNGEIEGFSPCKREDATHYILDCDLPEAYTIIREIAAYFDLYNLDIEEHEDGVECIFKLKHKGLKESDFNSLVGIAEAFHKEREKMNVLRLRENITTDKGFKAFQAALFRMNVAMQNAMLPSEREQYGTIITLEKGEREDAFILSALPTGTSGEAHSFMDDSIFLGHIAKAMGLIHYRWERMHDSDRDPISAQFEKAS